MIVRSEGEIVSCRVNWSRCAAHPYTWRSHWPEDTSVESVLNGTSRRSKELSHFPFTRCIVDNCMVQRSSRTSHIIGSFCFRAMQMKKATIKASPRARVYLDTGVNLVACVDIHMQDQMLHQCCIRACMILRDSPWKIYCLIQICFLRCNEKSIILLRFALIIFSPASLDLGLLKCGEKVIRRYV